MVSQNNLLPHFEDEEEAKRVLQAEGRKIKYIAVKLWRQYLSSYTPKKYVRTRDSQRSIKLGKVKMIGVNEYAIELTWDNDLTYHNSYPYLQGKTKRNQKGHSIMLISDGWHSEKLAKVFGREVPRYTKFNGTGYLAKVYKEYMNQKDRRITVETQWSGKYTKG